MRRGFEDVSDEEFGAWGWQVKNRIDDVASLERVLDLTEAERAGFDETKALFRFGVTPYYALLADASDPTCPVRRQIVPRREEATVRIGELADPLGEVPREVVPNLVHRYPDRVLLLSTDRCPVYCRFCTRRRIVGRTERQSTRALLDEAFEYIAAHDEIREVIVSGGDALMLGDNQLDHMFERIREAPHVDIIRVGTRMPVTCPMRVTDRLVSVLSKYKPVYVMTHFNHVKECTDEAEAACARLVDAGLVVYNQTVLLRGVNDDVESIASLNRRLVRMRVTPYYLHQCDMAEGIEHFRTPLEVGLSIVDGLRGHMSGLAVPQFCVDVPGGLGKVTMLPEWVVDRDGGATTFRTYTGASARYLDPADDVSRADLHVDTSKPGT
ncbi:MAG: KamA family radical SAM protein [Deltaproteobacteria bacterium]